MQRCPCGRRRRVLVYLSLLTLAIFTSYLLFIPSNVSFNSQQQGNAGRRIQSAIVYQLEGPKVKFPSSRITAPEITKSVSVEATTRRVLLPSGRVVKVVHNKFRYQPPEEHKQASVKVSSLAPMATRATTKTTMPKLGVEDSKNDRIVNRNEQEPPDVHSEAQKDTPKSPEMIRKMPMYSPRRYILDAKGYERYKAYLNEVEPPLPKQEKAVIILTNHRSGSSFFGELFNQHPDAFYLFEPLFPLSNSSECKLHSDLKIQVLKDLVQCQLPNWVEIYKGIPYKEQITKNVNMKQCIGRGMCFRQNTKEMCEDRHCPRTNSSSIVNCANDCGRVNPSLAANDCRRKHVVVLKVIRFCDILQLKRLTESTSTDVKILHLLRDPRGIANSRQLISRRTNLKESLYMTCKRQSHNMISALVNTPDWLKGKYMVVRYEDVALFPYETAQSVYDFVGLTFPESMKNWIAKNTDIEIPTNAVSDEQVSEALQLEEQVLTKNRMRREISHLEVQRQVAEIRRKYLRAVKPRRANPYGTKRNSTTIVQKWASRLPYSTVMQIESVCWNVMRMAGYRKVGTPEQYKIKDSVKYFTDEMEILKKLKQT